MCQCPYCGRGFEGDRVNSTHLAKCHPVDQHVEPCLCGFTETSLKRMKNHRKTCAVWQARDAKAVLLERQRKTCLERYGTENGCWTPESRAKREATCIERYGGPNPMGDPKIAALAAERGGGPPPPRYGSDNSFSKPEVQAKIYATMQEKYGAKSPQQVPEIRARTLATTLERYGNEQLLAVPEIRDQIRATCEIKYGGPGPSSSEEVQAKQRATNMTRYGVPWTSMVPEFRRKQLETMEEHYGSHYWASDQGKLEIRAIMREKYGVEFAAQMDGNWEKMVKTFQERYGVDHPLQLSEYREKARATCTERYGTPFPGLCTNGPNLLEGKVAAMDSRLMWTGNGKFWKRLPSIDAYKNPDFIVPGPVPGHPFRGVTQVVEIFGNFWHSRIFTGKAPFEHEQELIEAFRDIGIECLVIWESEVKQDPAEVAQRLKNFLDGTTQTTALDSEPKEESPSCTPEDPLCLDWWK